MGKTLSRHHLCLSIEGTSENRAASLTLSDFLPMSYKKNYKMITGEPRLTFPAAQQKFDSIENFVYRSDLLTADQVASTRQFKKSMNKTEVFQNGKVCSGVKTGPFYHTHGGAK